jgi:hypothetical protein
LFDKSSAEKLEVIGEISDGDTKSEIIISSSGVVFGMCQSGMQTFYDIETWVDSLADEYKKEAVELIESWKGR